MQHNTQQDEWDWEITNQTSWWDWKLIEVWTYRNLLVRLVRRDFLVNHQQTLLGPLWMLFQPLLTLATYVLVFKNIVGISTGNTPPVLFYLSGIILWTFFSESFTSVSYTFTHNVHIFEKVYFPRLIIPLSVMSANFMRLLLQSSLLVALIVYYSLFQNVPIEFNNWLLAAPFCILLIGLNGLSAGLLFAVLTAKYRDLTNVAVLGIRLMMFVTPVIYSVSIIPAKVRWLAELNPLTPLFELCRFALLREGTFTASSLIYSLSMTTLLFVVAMVFFNKQGDKIMDVI